MLNEFLDLGRAGPVHIDMEDSRRFGSDFGERIGGPALVHCRREGALDAAIEDAELNDFATLLRVAPRLASAVFNGLEAARNARRLAHLGLHTAVAPSTSPAYTLPLARKVERWRAVWPMR